MLIQTAAHAHTLSDRWQSLRKQRTKSVCTVTISARVSALHRHTDKYEQPNIHPTWSLAHHSYAFGSVSELLVCTDKNAKTFHTGTQESSTQCFLQVGFSPVLPEVTTCHLDATAGPQPTTTYTYTSHYRWENLAKLCITECRRGSPNSLSG